MDMEKEYSNNERKKHVFHRRKQIRREGRARREEERAERKRKYVLSSSSDEEDEKKERKKRPKGDERGSRHKEVRVQGEPLRHTTHKREDERKTKKDLKEKKGHSSGSASEKTKSHSGYHFNYGRSNNNVSDSKKLTISGSHTKSDKINKMHYYSQTFGKDILVGKDGKPKPKNKDKVGFYSSSSGRSDKNKNTIVTKHNNNEGGTGNLIQNPLFCGQGRWTSYVLVINRLIPNSLLPVSIKEEKSSPPSNSTLMPPPPPPTISAKSQQLKTSPTSPMISPSSDTVKDMGRDQETKQNFNDLELIWKPL